MKAYFGVINCFKEKRLINKKNNPTIPVLLLQRKTPISIIKAKKVAHLFDIYLKFRTFICRKSQKYTTHAAPKEIWIPKVDIARIRP